MPNKLLIVDDEQEWLDVLKTYFNNKGYETSITLSGEEAWKAISETMYDLVLSDLAMPDLTGLELLQRVRLADAHLPFIMMTGVGSIDSAVEAVSMGAYHYVTKPFKMQELEIIVSRAVEHGKLHRRLESLKPQQEGDPAAPMVLSGCKQMQAILNTMQKVSDSDVPVLIEGETGTGKTLLAKQIHAMSSRSANPFFTIDCASLTESLLESELFGHVKGAFTGAVAAKRGLLEEAQKGTVFLDEIGELGPSTQVKLLRTIQEREIKPVGGNASVRIDVRFITATSRILANEVQAERFREDLYYRLAVIPLRLPPLRERREDIIPLVGHFVNKFKRRYNKSISQVTPKALQMLMSAQWKGNIRELENVIERAVLLSEGEVITPSCLCMPSCLSEEPNAVSGVPVSLQQAVSEAERKAIQQALTITKGNRTQAAILLGIGRRTLYDKIDEHRL